MTPAESKDAYTERELEIYTQCPARYRDEYIDGLHGGRDESAYIRFHRCVYKTIGWLEAERANGNVKTVAEAWRIFRRFGRTKARLATPSRNFTARMPMAWFADGGDNRGGDGDI